MLEAEPSAGAVELQHEPGTHQSAQGRFEGGVRQLDNSGEQIARELPADGRGHLGHPLGIAQPIEASGQRILDGGGNDHDGRGAGLRQWRRPAFDQSPRQLLDEEGDPVRGNEDPFPQRRVEAGVVNEPVDDLGAFLAIEPVERDVQDFCRIDPITQRIGPHGKQSKQWRLMQTIQQKPEPLARGRISPMQILEHDGGGLFPRERQEVLAQNVQGAGTALARGGGCEGGIAGLGDTQQVAQNLDQIR